MATFASKLDDYQWWFFEKGGMHIYNELKRVANADGDGTKVDMDTDGTYSTIGEIVLDSSGGLKTDPSLPVGKPQAVGRSDSPTLSGLLRPSRPPTQYQT